MVILASGSPRRKELLALTGVEYEIITSDCDETPTKTKPSKIVEELSKRKCDDVYDKCLKAGKIDTAQKNLIIAADTLVFLGNEHLGKPGTRENSIKMLKKLSGRTHEVITAVTLLYTNEGCVKEVSFHEKTEVEVYALTEGQIKEYVETDEPLDKAGAYAIQGYFAKFIKGIRGEYSNVVGLPIARLYHEMINIGFIKGE